MKLIKNFTDFSEVNESNPCWDGYKQIGTKKKKGKIVPNCVPVKESDNKQTYDYGCSMIYFDFPKMNEIHSMIDEEDVYTEDGDSSYGLETEPHTTLLYGLHSDEIDDDLVMGASTKHGIPGELKLHNASLFQNDKYDVLKFDVDDDHLHKINGELCKLPHTTDYPDYHPHSTVAYLKKGKGEKYTEKLKDSWYAVNPSKIVYSKPDGSKIEKSI
jgi:hypothetical protein